MLIQSAYLLQGLSQYLQCCSFFWHRSKSVDQKNKTAVWKTVEIEKGRAAEVMDWTTSLENLHFVLCHVPIYCLIAEGDNFSRRDIILEGSRLWTPYRKPIKVFRSDRSNQLCLDVISVTLKNLIMIMLRDHRVPIDGKQVRGKVWRHPNLGQGHKGNHDAEFWGCLMTGVSWCQYTPRPWDGSNGVTHPSFVRGAGKGDYGGEKIRNSLPCREGLDIETTVCAWWAH